jgi:hypothetical protein
MESLAFMKNRQKLRKTSKSPLIPRENRPEWRFRGIGFCATVAAAPP